MSTMRSNSSSARGAFDHEVQQAATKLEHARANNYQIPPLHQSMPDLDQSKGYSVAAAIRALREDRNGEVVVGRKIGFSNRNIWPEYGIDASNWSYMYESSSHDLTELEGNTSDDHAVNVDISHFSALQPRIEPEIVFGLARAPSSAMNDEEILRCVDWIAHGYEIVVSIYPDWKFTAADTTAAFALHGVLLVGPKMSKDDLSKSFAKLIEQLSTFEIRLKQNGEIADSGSGSNVHGSPIKALRHLIELLEKDSVNRPLEAGEIITTGTLTRALPIEDGDVWSTELKGINLPGLNVRFRSR